MKAGWKKVPLSEVAMVFDGPHATPKTVDCGPIFLGINALQGGVINLDDTRHVTESDFEQWTRRVKPQPGDVVFSYETKLGEAALIPEGIQCCLGRRMGLIRFHEGAVLPKFFLYQYLSPQYREFLESKTIRGATVDRLSIRDFPSFQVTVPALSEQQRIVAILDEAFDGIATAKINAERNLQNARALFESHLESVFTEVIEQWPNKHLVELCLPGRIITYGVIKLGEEIPDGIPCLRTSNIRWLRIELEGMKRIAPGLSSEYSRTILQGREVLVNVRGTLGGVAVASSDMVGWNVSREVAVVPVDPQKVNPDFISYLIGSSTSQRWLGGVKKGAAYVGINIEDLRLLPVSVPPLEKQLEIVQHIEQVHEETQRLESIYRQKLTALDDLKKSLLHQAFTGQL